MKPMERRVLTLCFFISGATSLVLEVAWSKQLSYVLGNSLYAIATVVAAFMAGLSLGSALAGRWGPRVGRPLLAYTGMQLLIGACGMLSIPLLRATEPVFSALHGWVDPGHALFLLARFLFVFAMLVVPVTLMGMTLPVVIGAFARGKQAYSLEAGTLYGVNTLGAVVGTLGAGFLIVPALGLLRTGLFVGLVDVAVGLVAFGLDRRVGAIEDTQRAGPGATAAWSPGQWVVGLLFGLSGVVAMVYEVGWFRLLSLTLGPSVYAFSAMLGIFLTGIGLGSAVAAPWVQRTRIRGATAMWLMETLIAVTGLSALYYANTLPATHVRLFEWAAGRFGESGFVIAQLGSAALIVLVPCLVMGALFPVAVRALQEAGERGSPESNVGRLYMLNAGGSIFGSLLAGFWLLPRAGVWNSLLIGGLVSAAIAATVILVVSKGRTGRRLATATVTVFVAGLFAFAAPPWDTVVYNQGLYRRAYQGDRFDPEHSGSSNLVYYREGINAPVAIYNSVGDGFLKVSGKSDASTIPYDKYTQSLAGHFPVILARTPRRVAMIGYGSGMSAASVLSYPEVESLDIIELEQAVIDASPYFECLNDDPFDDPRTRLVVEDGRIHLTYSDTTYDVIISEPSNPWMAGIANLFTTDFYRTVRRRLAPGGVFGQWIQAYQISDPVMRSIVATLHESFPHVVLFHLSPFDVMILASEEPIGVPWGEFERRFEEPDVSRSYAQIGIMSPCDVMFYLRIPDEQLKEFFSGVDMLSTDDNVWLEHVMPREIVREIFEGRPDLLEEIARVGASHRIGAIASLLPGLPLDTCVPEIALYPHTSEPVTIPNRTSADPWKSTRATLRDGMIEELLGMGRPQLAGAVADADRRGEAYRSDRVAVTNELSGLLGSGQPPDPETIREALARAPDHPLALLLMGDTLSARGDLDGAERYYSAVARNPFNSTSYNAFLGLAGIAWRRGEIDIAVGWCYRAIARNPYTPMAYATLAEFSGLRGDPSGRRAVLEQGLRFNPGDALLEKMLGS